MTTITSIYRGDDVVITITAVDPAGAPIDITGADISFGVFNAKTRAEVLVKTTDDEGIEITDGDAGEFEVTLESDETEGLLGDYIYEVQITDSDNKVITLGDTDLSPPILRVVADLIT